jgi:hypothetical protein
VGRFAIASAAPAQSLILVSRSAPTRQCLAEVMLRSSTDERAGHPSLVVLASMNGARISSAERPPLRLWVAPSRRGEGVPYKDAKRQMDLSIDRPRKWVIFNDAQAQTATIEWHSAAGPERDHVHCT